jgi:hypothetical protein
VKTFRSDRKSIRGFLLTYPKSKWSYVDLVEAISDFVKLEIYSNLEQSKDLRPFDVIRFILIKNHIQTEIALYSKLPVSNLISSLLKLQIICMLQVIGMTLPSRFARFTDDMRKVSNLQLAYRSMWERALQGEERWFAFFEDDAQIGDQAEVQRLGSVVFAALSGALGAVGNVELSKSFTLRELGIEGRHSSELRFGEADLMVFPVAATNTTCASLLSRDLVQALLDSWNPSCRLIPVDLYVRIVAIRKGLHSAFLLDGLRHRSQFRPKRLG